jgi:ABC-type nitrate/sulfonate/bicarbonate transport system substrate-binding protein
MKLRVNKTTFIIAAAIVIVAWAYFWRPGESRLDAWAHPTAISFRLNGSFGSKFAGEIVAARADLFEHERLHVELKQGSNEYDPITSVVNGVDTFGVIDSVNFLVARSKGQPVVAFAAGYLETSVVFYALEKSGIQTLADFIGKRVVRDAAAETAIIYDATLINAGIRRNSTLETVTKTPLAALVNDEVDVIPGHVGKEAFVLHQKGISYNVIRVSDYGIHVPGTVYFTTENFLREHPSIVQAFLRAIIAGWNLTYADTSKSVPLLVSTGDKNLTPEQVEFELAAQRNIVKPPGRRVTEFDDLQWKQLRLILSNARLIDGSANLSAAVDYDILKEAYRKPISFGN